MANFDPPPRRPRRSQRRQPRRPIPWKWLGLGVVAAAVLLVVLLAAGNAWLTQAPQPAAVRPEPTIIRLTAPPEPTASPTSQRPTPSPVPTFTPIPTPDVAVAPEEVTAGYYAEVANTDGLGVTVRGGPSTSNIPVTVAQEGIVLFVVDGPQEGSGFQWWQVRLADGTEGWVAADFLIPAAAPQ